MIFIIVYFAGLCIKNVITPCIDEEHLYAWNMSALKKIVKTTMFCLNFPYTINYPRYSPNERA